MAAVTENARKIIQALQAGGSFAAYARQFSEASTAVVGGDLGWVKAAQLPGSMGEAATQMQPGQLVGRSEEHTSELQSLMRISYAVFCLKKKKKKKKK